MKTTNHTNGSIKKYFYSGIGLAAHTKDIMQKSADEFAKHNRMNEGDGKRIFDNALEKLENRYNEAVHKLMLLSNMEMSKLKTRIERLEKKISINTKPARSSVTPSPKGRKLSTSMPRRGIRTKSAKSKVA